MCEREMCVTADKTNYKSVINTRTKQSGLNSTFKPLFSVCFITRNDYF